MPGPAFFRQLGLFVASRFLDPSYSAALCREMTASPTGEALIVARNGEEHFDEDIRKVDCRILATESRTALQHRLRGLMPALEKHFSVALADCEPPECLIYHPGYFFKPHRDGGYSGNNAHTRRRRVSVVIFLNRESEVPAADAYGQGHLSFYDLLDGPHWNRCVFPLNADPGLLVAFPSEMLHEVTPVVHGRRFTVVSWFVGAESSSA
jgi:SM-20-related protein